MGTFKREEAKKADTALVDAPASAIDARTKIISQLSLIDELLKEPPDNNYENATGRALVHPGSNTDLELSLSQQAERLAELNCAFMGYDTNSYLSYDFGVIEDYLESVNLTMSDTSSLTVVIVNQEGDTEVPMSNEIGSTFTIGSNTFSNYIGDYYIVQDYSTHELLNVDDHVGVFVAPSPYTAQNLINGEIAIKPEDGDVDAPTSATDTRFDFRISNSGVTVADVYTPQTIHNIKLNSVSNDVSFVAGETLLSGDMTMLLDSVLSVNTVTMAADLIGISKIERGNTGFETSDQVQGLSSGAFGFVSTVNTAFRWSLTGTGVELTDDFIATIEGYDQDAFSQLYGTMNLVNYVAATSDALYPAKIRMHHDMKSGVANTRSGQLVISPDANTVSLGPPALGKTIPLRRWRDHDEDNPAHTTGLLAILSARGLQINYDWFVANNRHEGGLNHDQVTKLDNVTFVPYLGWGANTDIGIVASTRRTENRSSTANNGSNNNQYYSGTGTERPDDHYNELEKNPFYPASVEDMPDGSSPYAGIYAYWDDAYNSGAGAVGFCHYSELRWRYQPNPFLSDYNRDNSDAQVFNSISLPGYSSGGKEHSLTTVRNLRAPDALDAGFQRLIQSQYDGFGSNTGTFRLNLDGDVPGTIIRNITDWTNPGTTSFDIPAWTRDTGSQYPWNNNNTSTANSTYLPFPIPQPGSYFQTYNNLLANQANNTTGAYPFSAASGHYEPGVYYIKQSNQYGVRVYKVTGTYVQNTTVETSNAGGVTTTTTYYNHHLIYHSEEYDTPLNLYARLFDSNDWKAVTHSMPNRMQTAYAGNYTAMPDGHWDLYFGAGERDLDSKYSAYFHGNNAGNNSIDTDTATFIHILDHTNVMKEFETSFNDFFLGLDNNYLNKDGFTWTLPYDTNTLYNALIRTRDQTRQWKTSFETRIGYPVSNSTANTTAGGYSKELYEISDVLINDSIGPLTKAGNAIKNLDGVYDDVISNRTKYRIFST